MPPAAFASGTQATFDDAVFSSPVWKDIEGAAEFWKAW